LVTTVAIATRVFGEILLEAGIGHHVYQHDATGVWPAFEGNAATLAQFVLAAQAHLGPGDAALLAVQVREMTYPTAVTEHVYYFPGLELY